MNSKPRKCAPSPLNGKSLKRDVVAITCCDFGEIGRRTEITRHYSIEAGRRAFPKWAKIYCQLDTGYFGSNCWLEDKHGNILMKADKYGLISI